MSKICCFTGHRKIDTKYLDETFRLLKENIDLLANDGYEEFRAGGAIGFDALAALAVLEVKKKCPNIKLNLMLPCLDQDKYWSSKEKAVYEYIKRNADSIVYVREKYSANAMRERNRRLVDGSDICIAFLQRKGSGSSYTCNYANEKKIPVLNIYKELSKA